MLYTHTHTIHLENEERSSKKIRENKIEERAIRNKKGITLIALVITIIVLLILAGVSIAMLTGTNGILTQAQKAKLSTELSSYKEQLELYKTEKLSENREFLESTLTVGKESLKYNTQPDGETGNIKTVIPSIKDEYIDKIEVIKGALLINTQDKNEIEIAKSLGIAANPYDIVNGELLSSNGNLLLMDETGTLTIPDSVTKIGEGAFANLEGLKTIIIPGTVKEIGTNAFAYNKTLETVIMQEGVEIIGGGAFRQCGNLKNVQMPESLIEMNAQAFYYDLKLEKISIPSKIEIINSYTFSACKSLNEIKLPKNLKEIQTYAFSETKLSKITIPETITQIATSAFSFNKDLSKIVLEGKNNNYVYENGMLMPKTKDTILFISDSYLNSITTFKIPDGITNFEVDLSNYTNITKIIIPEQTQKVNASFMPYTINEVEVNAQNSKLAVSKEKKILYDKNTKDLIMCFSKDENINLKDEKNEVGITSLLEYSFKPAVNAKYIILPDSLLKINAMIFNTCKNIEQIEVGKNVSEIDPLFKYTNYTGNVVIDSNNQSYAVENNILYNKDKTILYSVLYWINGEFTPASSVKEIGDRAFHNQNQMTKINFTNTIKNVGNSFNYCYSLTSIDIPKNIENIGAWCFSECSNLSTINIHKKENSILGAPWGAPKGMKVINWDS